MKKITIILSLILVSALFAGIVSAAEPNYRDVGPGAAAFVFEDIAVDNASATSLTQYSDGPNPVPINVIAGKDGKFQLTEEVVNGMYGAYYYNGTPKNQGHFILIWYPEITLKAELTTDLDGMSTSGDSINGKSIDKGTFVSFKIGSPKVAPAFGATAKLIFTTPAGGKTLAFGGEEFNQIQMNRAETIMSPVAPGNDAEAGTWTVQAQYVTQPFMDYAEKSNVITFDVRSTSLSLTAAKDSVIRNNPFVVTIQGASLASYLIYLDGASETDINPTLQPFQEGWQTNVDDYIGGAVFKTDAFGKRNVQYNTAADTADKIYTVMVNGICRDASSVVRDTSDYDSVKVKVEKGSVTISASGDGSYYIGDEIKLTGTNTDSDYIFLFLTGQNLAENGIVLKDLPTKTAAKFGAGQYVPVKTDDTWEYKWDTSRTALDTGAYTIYATSKITNGKSSTAEDVTIDGGLSYYTAVKLSDSEYATVSINLKQPFLSAVPSGIVVAKGDKIYIHGTAEGDPSNLKLYIFGPNFFEPYTITVEDDGSYEKKIDISSTMSSNQYFVVVQHPMYNNEFDAYLTDTTNPGTTFSSDSTDQWAFKTRNTTTGGDAQSFIVWGSANKLQGSQAADALTKMIDSANIDDIYTKLTFTVAEPWIKITNPGDKATGSKFTISGTTNLAVDDQILVEVMSSSFSAVDKTSTSTTSGVSQTTKVVAGEGTDNTWSVDVDTTNWKLDEYTIKVQGIEVDVTTTTNFNLVEKVVTTTPTTAATTTVPTGATATATTAPTQTPGFGAFIALAGLGAVALLVLRRN